MGRSSHEKQPRYRGEHWIKARLPAHAEPWLHGRKHSIRKRSKGTGAASAELTALLERHPWTWPKRPVYFFSDPHADADAMIASLVASGGIRKTGARDKDFRLTKAGRKAQFLIGGDCFDKGPSCLRLLRTLKRVSDRGGDLRILAGNHDVRTMLGMRSLLPGQDPMSRHFFIRMGGKAIPLLKEIHEHYVTSGRSHIHVPGTHECRRLLYPGKTWFREFPKAAAELLPQRTINREIGKLNTKIAQFEELCHDAGLELDQVYAAALQWHRLFLDRKGEFSWFYRQMRLALRRGSFLFLHAGLDDDVAWLINDRGVRNLNREFRRQLHKGGFRFYYGSIANAIRTKYRSVDKPLSRRGASLVHDSGIHVIVHGHRSLNTGQRITLRKEMVNFECDITMDRHSRRREGLKGPGAGVTVIHPAGHITGISTDYPRVKIFDPRYLGLPG
jgi:hypothetical protein